MIIKNRQHYEDRKTASNNNIKKKIAALEYLLNNGIPFIVNKKTKQKELDFFPKSFVDFMNWNTSKGNKNYRSQSLLFLTKIDHFYSQNVKTLDTRLNYKKTAQKLMKQLEKKYSETL